MSYLQKFQTEYDALKEGVISRIRTLVTESEDRVLGLYETHRCPALVINEIDDQESEVIHELYLDGKDVMASAGVYEDDVEYNLNEFEVPFLLAILDSAEKHTDVVG